MTDTEFEYLDMEEKMESESRATSEAIYNYLLGLYQNAWTGNKDSTIVAMMRDAANHEETQAILQFAALLPDTVPTMPPNASD